MTKLPFELVLYSAFLFLIPARFVVPGFGAAGPPATLIGVSMLGLLVLDRWYSRTHRSTHDGIDQQRNGVSPVAIALFVYFGVLLASWVVGRSEALSTLASNSSDRAAITAVSLFGLSLFVLDRIRTWDAVESVIDMMITGTMVMCALGLIQFFTGRDPTTLMRLPGLVENSPGFSGVPTRATFNRPFGTALHPIEFGVVSGSVAPIAYWRARHGGRVRDWIALGVIALAAMTSVSRSAVLALAVGGLVLFLGASWRDRLNLAIGSAVFTIAAGSVIPGLVGTLRGLFLNAGTDPSVQFRIRRTPEVLRLISEHPWFGRGFGTYTIQEYLLLDNEIQRMAIELGVLGVAAFVGFILIVAWTASNAQRHDSRDPQLGLALLASILAVAISYYTFDAFFYRILNGILYVNIALVGVVWRLSVSAVFDTGNEPSEYRSAAGRALPQSASTYRPDN